jgi:hypothetical protein
LALLALWLNALIFDKVLKILHLFVLAINQDKSLKIKVLGSIDTSIV